MRKMIRMMILLVGLVTACYAEDPVSDFPEHCPSNTDFTVKPGAVYAQVTLNDNLKSSWELRGNILLLSALKNIPADTPLLVEKNELHSRMECQYQLTNHSDPLTARSKRHIDFKLNFPNFHDKTIEQKIPGGTTYRNINGCTTTADNPSFCSWKYD